MARLIVLGGVLAFLVGCQSGPSETAASDQERTAATKALLDCIRAAVPRFDDRISDASTVGNAIIRGPCHGQADGVVQAYTRGSNSNVKRMFESDFYGGQAQATAVEIILAERAKAP